MIDANKLQYFTMASWARGYAAALDEYEDKYLKQHLEKMASMLEYVFSSEISRGNDEDNE